jgi:hypothetical protein
VSPRASTEAALLVQLLLPASPGLTRREQMIRKLRTLVPVRNLINLSLSYICSKIDDLLWTHYAQDMVELLTRDPSVPGIWWSTRRNPGSVEPRPKSGRIR